MGKTVTFLSTKKRGMNIDLKLIQNYLQANVPEISYRYYLGNENSDNFWKAAGHRRLKETFCQDAEVIICIDGSLSGSLRNLKAEQKRLLMMIPFDYLFRAFMEKEKTKKVMLKGFTHVIAPSPFCRKVLEEYYDLEGIELITDACTPYGMMMDDKKMQNEMRHQMEHYFPQAAGKKIIAILFSGEEEEGKDQIIGDVEWEAILDHIGEGGFILTNSSALLNSMAGLSICYQSSVGYMNELFMARDVLPVADVLLTNNSAMASYFAAKRKEIYCFANQSGEFGQYMKQYYPEMYLSNLNALTEIDFYRNELSDMQRKFHEEHSYSTEYSPFEKIADIIQDTDA